MLSIWLETYDGAQYELPVLLRWDLDYTGMVPCDSMTAACLYDAGMAEVLPKATRFTAYQDGEIMLRGIIDGFWWKLKAGAWPHSCWITSRRH